MAGIKDYCAIFFYTLTCIIVHAIIQEFLLDVSVFSLLFWESFKIINNFFALQKISKKLHLSKFKLSLFNESGQLIAFYLLSFVWGAYVIMKEGYFGKLSLLWEGFPDHPMTFLHKFFFIIQMAYYLHMLPELYFQKVKKEEQQSKIVHSISGFSIICLAYSFG